MCAAEIKMIDHPTFMVFVDQVPHYEPNQTPGYILSGELAKLVNRIVTKGYQVFITTKKFEFPPIYPSCLLFTGDQVLLRKEYNGEHVFLMQYYQEDYSDEEMDFVRYMFDDLYQVGVKHISFDGRHLVNKGMFEPAPKSFPIGTQTEQ